jgi:hypothetical protein
MIFDLSVVIIAVIAVTGHLRQLLQTLLKIVPPLLLIAVLIKYNNALIQAAL